MLKSRLHHLPILLAIWLAVYFESALNMMSVWMQSKTYEHGILIVPISLWLAWKKKDIVKHTAFTPSLTPVILMLLPALLWMLGKAANIALFQHCATILSLQLLLWFVLGTAKAKVLSFPIFYLSFCIPFGEEFIPYLQNITADISVFLVKYSNIPIYRDGLFLFIPNGVFEVAEACSGIRFLISSIALGCLFSYLNFTCWRKHIAFVIFSFFFPIMANGIRAYGIILIGHYVGMEHATGADHLVYGWVFFSFIIISIFIVANKFADPEKKSTRIYSSFSFNQHNNQRLQQKWFFLSLLCIFVSQLVWAVNLNTENTEQIQPITLPHFLTHQAQSNWGIDFPYAKQSALTKTKDSDIEVYLARSNSSNAKSEFISYENHFFDQEHWRVVSQRKLNTEKDISLNQIKIADPLGEIRHVTYWYCINDICTDSKSKVKLLKAFYTLGKKPMNLQVTAIFSKDFTDNEIRLFTQLL